MVCCGTVAARGAVARSTMVLRASLHAGGSEGTHFMLGAARAHTSCWGHCGHTLHAGGSEGTHFMLGAVRAHTSCWALWAVRAHTTTPSLVVDLDTDNVPQTGY